MIEPTYTNLASPWRHKRHLLAHWLGMYNVLPSRYWFNGESWIQYYCATCGKIEPPERELFPRNVWKD